MEVTDLQIALPFDSPRPVTPPDDLILVRHPRARRYVLRLTHDGAVRVTLPRWGSKKEARAFAERERAWIEKQRRKWAERQERREVQRGAEGREGHEERVGELRRRLLELATVNGLTVTRISIRNQKWRWGSCSRDGHICLNWRLVLLPDRVRDYVLIHELMHLKRMDHSPKFWKLVEGACPDYRDLRRQLRAAPLESVY
jgi:predicted metal-dependent hydrolase